MKPAPQQHRDARRAVRAVGVRRQRRRHRVHARHDAGPEGRDPQPPVGRRAVRRRQHRGRRRDPRRPRHGAPADRSSPTCCASAPPTCPIDDLPDGSLHPLRIRAGVVDGVADYGNKIGLPTVAGAVLYDPAYTTNPLVFAGCIGVAPTRPVHDGPYPGDRIVVLGGATGRDGIRGATFSSATMDATTGEVAGASVQIGDPVVEKLLIDALVGAEDLYSAHHRLRRRRPVVGGRRDGRGGRRRRRSRPGAAQVSRPRAVGGLAVGGPGAHGGVDRRRSARRARRRVAGVSASTSPTSASSPGPASSWSAPAAGWSPISTPRFLHDGAATTADDRRCRAHPDRTAGSPRHVDDPIATLLAILAHPNVASNEDDHPPLRPRDPRLAPSCARWWASPPTPPPTAS